ncbi:Inhibitor of sigma-G Gin [Paenibacillus larvae subsp. larvae]|nr:Inhibitor of sigma-G Gin [Paenibacillus larvae subsp. larvae]
MQKGRDDPMEKPVVCTCTCIICGREETDGITVLDGFICEACEAEMVRTDVCDTKYPFFVHQMKKYLLKK